MHHYAFGASVTARYPHFLSRGLNSLGETTQLLRPTTQKTPLYLKERPERIMFFTARTPKIKAEDVHTLSNPVIAEKSNGFGIPGTEGGAALL